MPCVAPARDRRRRTRWQPQAPPDRRPRTTRPVTPSSTSSCVAADAGRDDRQAGGHRLEDRVRHALAERRQHEHVEAAHDRRHVVPLAGEPGEVAHAALGENRLDPGTLAALADDHETHRRAAPGRLLQRVHERPRQRRLVLHRVAGAPRCPRAARCGAPNGQPATRSRAAGGAKRSVSTPLQICSMRSSVHADRFAQVAREIGREARRTAMTKGRNTLRMRWRRTFVPSVIVDIAAVLAVDARRHPGKPRGRNGLECCEIAGVDDRRAHRAEQPHQRRIEPQCVARRLAERDHRHVAARDAATRTRDRCR